MSLPYSDNFTGSNGSAPSADWTLSQSTGASTIIQSNQMHMSLGSLGNYSDYAKALLADVIPANFDLTLDVTTTSNPEQYTGISFRGDGGFITNGNMNNGWRLLLGQSTQFWHLERFNSGVSTNLTGDLAYALNTVTVHVRIRCFGPVVKIKLWNSPASEPTEWTYQTLDSWFTTQTRFGLTTEGGFAVVSSYVIDFDNVSFTEIKAPVFKAAGAEQSATVGITVPWPTHESGDIGLLLLESCGGEPASLTTAAGFAALPNSPQSTGTTTNGTRITAFWCRATSSSMTSPVTNDPGNHIYGVILTFTNCIASGNPYDVTAGGVKATASTSMSMPSVTTTAANELVINIATRDTDSAAAAGSSPANADLTLLNEIWDSGTIQGNGGGIMVWNGVKATAGSVTNTTATVASSINAYLTVTLLPPVPAGLNLNAASNLVFTSSNPSVASNKAVSSPSIGTSAFVQTSPNRYFTTSNAVHVLYDTDVHVLYDTNTHVLYDSFSSVLASFGAFGISVGRTLATVSIALIAQAISVARKLDSPSIAFNAFNLALDQAPIALDSPSVSFLANALSPLSPRSLAKTSDLNLTANAMASPRQLVADAFSFATSDISIDHQLTVPTDTVSFTTSNPTVNSPRSLISSNPLSFTSSNLGSSRSLGATNAIAFVNNKIAAARSLSSALLAFSDNNLSTRLIASLDRALIDFTSFDIHMGQLTDLPLGQAQGLLFATAPLTPLVLRSVGLASLDLASLSLTPLRPTGAPTGALGTTAYPVGLAGARQADSPELDFTTFDLAFESVRSVDKPSIAFGAFNLSTVLPKIFRYTIGSRVVGTSIAGSVNSKSIGGNVVDSDILGDVGQ